MAHYLKTEFYNLIKQDEQIFEFIREGSFDGLWYWDLENPENEWMDNRFWEILGYDPAKMPHKASAWQNIINQDDLKVALENFHKHLADSQHPYDQHMRYQHKNGSTVWVRCRGIVIRDDNGKATRMVGTHQDITNLKNTEDQLRREHEKLKKSETRYKQLVETAVDAIYLIDEKGVVVDTNHQATLMLEKSKTEIIGQTVEVIDPNFPVDAFLEYWKPFPYNTQRTFITTHIDRFLSR